MFRESLQDFSGRCLRGDPLASVACAYILLQKLSEKMQGIRWRHRQGAKQGCGLHCNLVHLVFQRALGVELYHSVGIILRHEAWGHPILTLALRRAWPPSNVSALRKWERVWIVTRQPSKLLGLAACTSRGNTRSTSSSYLYVAWCAGA